MIVVFRATYVFVIVKCYTMSVFMHVNVKVSINIVLMINIVLKREVTICFLYFCIKCESSQKQTLFVMVINGWLQACLCYVWK